MSKQQKHFKIQVPKVDPMNFHDPLLENPLDDEMEGLITMVGERRYLKAIVERFGIILNFNVEDITDHECRKVLRGIMKHSSDYKGVEKLQ